MALYLCKNSDCSGLVTDDNPLQTKHTNQGEPQTIQCYLFNDGKRSGVENDTSGMELIYTNIGLSVVGNSHTLSSGLASSTSTTNVSVDSTDGWGIGTIIKEGLERMRIEEIISSNSVRVTRNYTADGGISVLSQHSAGADLVPETTNISFAPANIDEPATAGTFANGGESLSLFIAPTYLTTAISSAEAATTVVSGDGSQYAINDIIQIEQEQMKITNVSGNTLTVVRGYNGTARAGHAMRTTIYLVGMSSTYKAYNFFIKNDPPSGLPTQKKYDVKIRITSDEEPL